MEVLLLLWLLLPVAATSGWLAARRSLARHADHPPPRRLSPDYLKGLNYLLNEQSDKAIDVFIKLIDVDSETVETHLALGALFRRRGEVNRAIRIHQNLVSRTSLNTKQRHLAMLELAQDYQRAGLLDRAEDLYQQLIETGQYQIYAYRQLLDIYQQEHDWDKALHTAERLAQASGDNFNPIIAQYYCEQAEQYKIQGQFERTLQTLQQALRADPACVRASLLEGQLALEKCNIDAAIRAFKRVEQQDPLYLSEVIEPLQTCYRQKGMESGEFARYLRHVLESYGGITPMLVLARIIRAEEGEKSAVQFIVNQLRERPSVRGLAHFIELALLETADASQQTLLLLKEITSRLLKNKPIYKCAECGFNAKTLYWQCPSCKQWNVVKPIQGIDGE